MPIIFYRETPTTRSIKLGAMEVVLWTFAGLGLGAVVERLGSIVLADVAVFALFAAYPVYVALTTSRLSGTLAKRLGGVRVVRRSDGQPPTPRESWVRVGFQLLEALLLFATGPFGFAWLMFNRRKHQGWWHDHRAGTRVEWAPRR